jgi:CBS-domain-containing membrane protein
MKVAEIMCRPVETCTEETGLAAAARTMAEHDCGILPVVANGRLSGVVTDRDICVALGTRGRPVSDLCVRDVMSHHPVSCRTTDDVATALQSMAARLVRRLPVTDPAGDLVGIVSLDDVALRSEPVSPGKRIEGVGEDQFIRTFRMIVGRRKLVRA